MIVLASKTIASIGTQCTHRLRPEEVHDEILVTVVNVEANAIGQHGGNDRLHRAEPVGSQSQVRQSGACGPIPPVGSVDVQRLLDIQLL